MKFDFQFGKKKSSIFRYAIIGVILTSVVTGISQCTHIPEEQIYDIVDQVQRKIPGKPLNDWIINDPILLDRRIKGDVNRAIDAVNPEYNRIISEYDKKYEQKYIEYPIDKSVCYTDECKKLGGEIRICAPWVADCPKE
ncbi:hypothetical protein EBQ91_01145 [bacterium]|nr:hypothetical protein [bacterium]